MTIWCFGDSNTYGYDPRGFLGGRYANPWPELLAEKTGWQVINDGQNGRSIPDTEYGFREFRRKAEIFGAELAAVMLGTNDLLNGASARETARRMGSFLERRGAQPVLLIAPPTLRRGQWVTGDGLVFQSARLSGLYRLTAERLGIPFADADGWGIGLTFDGVHFTGEGHARFADGLSEALAGIL